MEELYLVVQHRTLPRNEWEAIDVYTDRETAERVAQANAGRIVVPLGERTQVRVAHYYRYPMSG